MGEFSIRTGRKEKKMKELYPNLAKYLRFLSPENIGQRTLVIEKSNNKKLLDEWIEYWTELNCIEAARIIVKLKNISEETKQEYEKKLEEHIINRRDDISKIFSYILANLYLNNESKIEKFFRYLKWILGIEGKDTENAEKNGPIEVIEYVLRKRDIGKVKSLEELKNVVDKIISKLHENIEYLSKDKIERIENFKEIREELNNADSYKEFINPIIDEIVKIRTLGMVNIYTITVAFTAIMKELLMDSNYKMIFCFIYLVEKCNLFSLIKLTDLSKLDKAPIMIVGKTIQMIIDEMIEKKEYDLAFVFLNKIGEKNYFKYIPNDKTIMEYVDLLHKMKKTKEDGQFGLNILNIERELFIKDKENEFGIEKAMREWLDYIDRQGKNNIVIARNKIITIYEIIKINPKILDDEGNLYSLRAYIKADELNSKIVLIIDEKMVLASLINVYEAVLKAETDIHTKKIRITSLKDLNFYLAQDEYVPENRNQIYFINTTRNHIKNIFIGLVESAVQNNLADIIYLYMNTCLKYDLALEDLVAKLQNKKLTNIFEEINKYSFYGKILKNKQSRIYQEYKILDINTKYKARTSTIGIINEKNILRIKIINYSDLYAGFEIEPIEGIASSASLRAQDMLNKNLKAYRDAYNNGDIETLIDKKIEFHEKNYLQIAHYQVEMLSKLNDENIICLMQDKINPFNLFNKFKYYKDFHHKFLKLKKIMNTESDSIKEDYKNRYKNVYEKLLKGNKLNINNIVYSYMNTAAKYYWDFDSFILILVQYLRKDKEQFVDLKQYFKNYEIYSEDIIGHDIVNPIQIISKNLVASDNFPYDRLYFYTFTISKYNFVTGKIEVEDVKINDKIARNSRGYSDLISCLNLYLNNIEDKNYIFSKLRNMGQIEEFKSLDYAMQHGLLYEYQRIYKDIVIKKIESNFDDVYDFVRSLGDNNFWEHKKYIIDGRVINTKSNIDDESIKNVFLKLVRKVDFEKAIYFYNNTFMKEILDINTLFNKIFKFNIFHNWKIDENNIVDLNDYNLVLKTVNIQPEAEEADKEKSNTDLLDDGILTLIDINNNMQLKIKLSQEDLNLLNLSDNKLRIIELTINKYGIGNNVLYCKLKFTKLLKDTKYKYNIEYLKRCNEILKYNYSIEYVYSYMTKQSVIFLNVYYFQTDKNTLFYKNFDAEESRRSLNTISDKCKKQFENNLEKYILLNIKENKINDSNIDKIFFIYDKTILKYIIPINKFTEYFKDIINKENVNIDTYIKFRVNQHSIGTDFYTVYIPRYSQLQLVKIIGNAGENLKLQSNYVAKMCGYLPESNSIVFHNALDMTLGAVIILESITKNANTDDELIELANAQINNIRKLDPNILEQFKKESQSSATYFLNKYGLKEKEKLTYIKNLITNQLKDEEEMIKHFYRILMKRLSINQLSYIVNYYMNTVSKYILSAQDFIEIIVEIFPDQFEEKNNIIDVNSIFTFYKISIDEIDENNKIQTVQFGDNTNIIISNDAMESAKGQDLLQGRIRIDNYDLKNKVIIAKKIFFRKEMRIMKDFIYNQVKDFYEQTGQNISKEEIFERIEIYLMAISLASECEVEALRNVEADTKILIENLQKKTPNIVDIKLIEPSLRLISYIIDKNEFEKRHIATAALGKLYDYLKILGDRKTNSQYYDIVFSKDEVGQPFLYQDKRHPENVLRQSPNIMPFVMTYCARNAAMHSQPIDNTEAHLISMFYTLIEVCYQNKYIILDKYMKQESLYQNYVNKIISAYKEKEKNNFKYILLNMMVYQNEAFDEVISVSEQNNADFERISQKFNHLKIIGYAGMGKTTMLENIMFKEISEFKKQKFNVKIPVILDMIKISNSNYKEMTIEKMISTKIGLNSDVLVKRMIEKNMFNIYIDGINEIRISEKTEKMNYLFNLEEFMNKHKGMKMIVTDRDDNSYSIANEIPTLIIIGVTEEIIKSFVLGNSAKPEIVWNKMETAIQKNPNLLNICKNPFMLKNLISIVECNKNIPEEKEEIIGVFLKSIVERERVLKKNELANDVLRVLIYLVAKEAESEENVQEDTIVLSSFTIFAIFNEYCDKYKRTNRFDNEEMLDLIVKLGILKEIEFEKYTFVEKDYFEFFFNNALNLGLL